MKVLICGLGSIGERHYQNLRALGHDVIVFRQTYRPPRLIKESVEEYRDLDAALSQNPEVAFICGPTAQHIPQAIRCARSNCHLFIEKPLGSSTDQIDELEKATLNKRVMVGYMLRFHPLLLKMKSMIESEELGSPREFHSIWSENLADWHPWEDFRKSYAAKKSLGGGASLTLSHHLDLAYWVMGPAANVSATHLSTNTLPIDVDENIEILLEHQSGAQSRVQLDYLGHPHRHQVKILFDNATARFDYLEAELVIESDSHTAQRFTLEEFDRNQMFVDEVTYFFEQIERNQECHPSLLDGKSVLEIALKALENANEKLELK